MAGFSFVVLIISLLSLAMLFICLVLHLNNHFVFQLIWCDIKKNKTTTPLSPIIHVNQPSFNTNFAKATQNQRNFDEVFVKKKLKTSVLCNILCCIFRKPMMFKDESFDVFPMAFGLHVLYVLILSFWILLEWIFCDKIVFNIHNNMLYSWENVNRIYIIKYNIRDSILVYNILIVSLWESFAYFYRYYSTSYCSKHLVFVPFKRLFRKYCKRYLIWYSIVFILIIHIFYYLSPLLIIINIGFNVFCTNKFIGLILKQYSIDNSKSNKLTHMQSEIHSNCDYMKRFSYISISMTAIYQTLFFVYGSCLMIFIPTLVGVSVFFWTLTFARNRIYIYKAKYIITKYCCTKVNQSLSNLKDKLSPKNAKPKQDKSKSKGHDTEMNQDNTDQPRYMYKPSNFSVGIQQCLSAHIQRSSEITLPVMGNMEKAKSLPHLGKHDTNADVFIDVHPHDGYSIENTPSMDNDDNTYDKIALPTPIITNLDTKDTKGIKIPKNKDNNASKSARNDCVQFGFNTENTESKLDTPITPLLLQDATSFKSLKRITENEARLSNVTELRIKIDEFNSKYNEPLTLTEDTIFNQRRSSINNSKIFVGDTIQIPRFNTKSSLSLTPTPYRDKSNKIAKVFGIDLISFDDSYIQRNTNNNNDFNNNAYKMMNLMVKSGFHSRKSFNSMQQLSSLYHNKKGSLNINV